MSTPFFEFVSFRKFAWLAGLATQSLALWFITAALLSISSFPPDSFHFFLSLPFTYWWGLMATLSLFANRSLLRGKARVLLELSSLFLLALYLLGLPSLTYEEPRILDSYQHAGNSLGLLNYGGWYQSPIWYVRQFPGAYTFFAQLISVAGLDPFFLVKFYTVGLSWLIVFFIYTIGKSFSREHAALASALFLGGIWFQLHVSPQSLELLPYLGIVYVVLKLVTDKPREKKWGLVAGLVVPGFVASHPETPLVTILAMTALLFVAFARSRKMLREILPSAGLFLLALFAWFIVWWGTVASETRNFVLDTIVVRALTDFSKITSGAPGIPSHPEYSYGVTITVEQATALAIWVLGLFLLLFFRRYVVRDSVFAGFFLAGISTIPVALFSKADVLQRSYLFALIPAALLAASLLERGSSLNVRGRSLSNLLKIALVTMVILFSLTMPVARYGIDPSEYVPASSLSASSVAAGLQNQSVLFLHPGEYGWRFYAALNGDVRGIRLEQANITERAGGFTKPTSTLDNFNLTATIADGTADYVVVSDYYQNLWILRFGSQSGAFLAQKQNFEMQIAVGSQDTQPFNLVYSTGTDRIYANTRAG